MNNRWPSSNFAGDGDVFRALHTGLTVSLISTPTATLKTCTQHESISEVLQRHPEEYDFIPVLDENHRFIGLFNAVEQRRRKSLDTVWRCYSPLSEENLIGADASILDFVLDADQRPCRLVISGAKIVGLVSISDLQRLPVRAALFALITGFEMTMTTFIRQKYSDDQGWINLLAPTRQQKIEVEKAKAKATDNHVDTLLFTQFCDKREIVRRQFPEARRKELGGSLNEIEILRNSIAHASEYAATRSQAAGVCEIVRSLLRLRDEFQAS